MTLAQCMQAYPDNVMQLSVLVLLRRDQEILLAMKKRGFGAGNWNGPGGKVKTGETISEAAMRETREEVGLIITSLDQVATLRFYFEGDDKPERNVLCRVFTSRQWQGTPEESEEMAPRWFNVGDIPYSEMWAGDLYWLPLVLKGAYVKAEFLFKQGTMLDKNVRSQGLV